MFLITQNRSAYSVRVALRRPQPIVLSALLLFQFSFSFVQNITRDTSRRLATVRRVSAIVVQCTRTERMVREYSNRMRGATSDFFNPRRVSTHRETPRSPKCSWRRLASTRKTKSVRRYANAHDGCSRSGTRRCVVRREFTNGKKNTKRKTNRTAARTTPGGRVYHPRRRGFALLSLTAARKSDHGCGRSGNVRGTKKEKSEIYANRLRASVVYERAVVPRRTPCRLDVSTHKLVLCRPTRVAVERSCRIVAYAPWRVRDPFFRYSDTISFGFVRVLRRTIRKTSSAATSCKNDRLVRTKRFPSVFRVADSALSCRAARRRKRHVDAFGRVWIRSFDGRDIQKNIKRERESLTQHTRA